MLSKSAMTALKSKNMSIGRLDFIEILICYIFIIKTNKILKQLQIQ